MTRYANVRDLNKEFKDERSNTMVPKTRDQNKTIKRLESKTRDQRPERSTRKSQQWEITYKRSKQRTVWWKLVIARKWLGTPPPFSGVISIFLDGPQTLIFLWHLAIDRWIGGGGHHILFFIEMNGPNVNPNLFSFHYKIFESFILLFARFSYDVSRGHGIEN